MVIRSVRKQLDKQIALLHHDPLAYCLNPVCCRAAIKTNVPRTNIVQNSYVLQATVSKIFRQLPQTLREAESLAHKKIAMMGKSFSMYVCARLVVPTDPET